MRTMLYCIQLGPCKQQENKTQSGQRIDIDAFFEKLLEYYRRTC